MKKAKFFGSYISATGHGFRGVVVAVLAGVMCLVGPAIDKTFAGDNDSKVEVRWFSPPRMEMAPTRSPGVAVRITTFWPSTCLLRLKSPSKITSMLSP